MTQRGPETLAGFYGFESAEALADSLPSDAEVADMGAGASRLGHTIAGLRPDIHWINLDIGYADQTALAGLQETAPDNLTLLEGSITNAAELVPPGSLDRVFSFWALGYLHEPEIREAVRKFVGLTKPTGQLALGKLWIIEDNAAHKVARPTTIRFDHTAFPGAVADHVAKAVKGTEPALAEADYFAVYGDESIA